MTYRKNEKGRFEAVTSDGIIIPFEDRSEMVAFIEAREQIQKLLGSREAVMFDIDIDLGDQKPKEKIIYQKTKKKVRIHKGKYVVKSGKIEKSLA